MKVGIVISADDVGWRSSSSSVWRQDMLGNVSELKASVR